MAWEQVSFKSIRDIATFALDKSLTSLERGAGCSFIWRGEPEVYKKGIVSRIDRPGSVLSGVEASDLLKRENQWYSEWWMAMMPLLLPRDTLPPARPDGLPELQWLNFAAHHGCQTRLVDWSYSPWVALYFACSQAFGRPGRVWCFDLAALGRALDARWDRWKVPLLSGGSGQRDITAAAFTECRDAWVVTQHNYRAPIRMASQQGLFTIASQLGKSHDALIDELVPDGSKFVIVIPDGGMANSWKAGILGFLRSMGVHHESLQYPMLDQVAGSVSCSWSPDSSGAPAPKP